MDQWEEFSICQIFLLKILWLNELTSNKIINPTKGGLE